VSDEPSLRLGPIAHRECGERKSGNAGGAFR
jgi:hypothetical protein